MNQMKSLALLALLTALLGFAGFALGGKSGLILGLIVAGALNFGTYWFSDRIVLRMYRAKQISVEDGPELFHIVQDLTQRAGMPMPRVFIIPEDAPNAFATGRNPDHAAVAVTNGLLALLNREELRGVLAHELAHVKNRDTLIMSITATIAGALSMIADLALWGSLLGNNSEDEEGSNPLAGLLGIMIAPFAAMLIQMSISRSREFLADEYGARLAQNPLSLASALRKIEAFSTRIPMTNASPSTAHLLIANPFRGAGLVRLFSTHPSTDDRVARLEQMARTGQFFIAS